jgi:asparagine N-glycosylation enzyme membrane subunit Stt3
MEIETTKSGENLKVENLSNEIEERRKKIFGFAKHKFNWIVYIILGFILILDIYIRTRNIPKLKDITTGTWTLGPDLDPFLFLRWAEYIVAHGTLMVHDTMRYVPLGYNTAGEMKLLSYMIAWFYYPISWITGEQSVTYAAIIFPVIMSVFATIAFFLLARKIFQNEKNLVKNAIALLSALFFILAPSLLPRTIAGIPEKESAAFFFMFMAFYFFLQALTAEKTRNKIILAAFSGISTGLMALIWGGFIFVFFTIPTAMILAYILDKVRKNEFIVYSIWLISSFVVMMSFSTRYSLENLVVSLSTNVGIGAFFILLGGLIIEKKWLHSKKFKIPTKIMSVGVMLLIILIITSIILGPGLIYGQLNEIKNSLTVPVVDRFGMTVAENKQPYFNSDWQSEFGPMQFGMPLYFWMLFAGAVLLFYSMVSGLNKKEKFLLTLSYCMFLFFLIFSRYSPSSIMNGTNGLSILVYLLGWILLIGTFLYIYNKKYKENRLEDFEKFDFSYIMYFIVFTLALIGARGGIRLIMVLGAISPIAVAFLVVKIPEKYFNKKEDFSKLIIGIIAILVLISAAYTAYIYYQSDKATAEIYAPSSYNMQWQQAMDWVRKNTPETAVFAHWWDYGYWLQSIGNRATILDGGNAIGYWNHLLGRHVLCGYTEKEALDFLYAHNGTHLLIDSTDIGKYTAFSSIGSDENYDKFSWIQTYLMDEKQTKETNNITLYIYYGGAGTDEDIIINKGGKEILLPKKSTGVGAILISENQNKEILQPSVIFIYNGQQYQEKLRYVYFNEQYVDFGSGIDAGVFIFPSVVSDANSQLTINERGALLYLSGRTVHTNLAQLYLFDKKSDNFILKYTQSSPIVDNLKSQGADFGEFIYYQGLQGPIKIWEIKYPSNIALKKEYIDKTYPLNIKMAKSGEYN